MLCAVGLVRGERTPSDGLREPEEVRRCPGKGPQ